MAEDSGAEMRDAEPNRYEVAPFEEAAWGQMCYQLRDLTTGSEARLLPGVGSNLYSFSVPVGGAPLEVLASPDPARPPDSMRRYGVPILFPFPNRVRGGRFTFMGKSYQMDTDESGNAIHGFVWSKPWRVDAARATEDAAILEASLDSREYPDILRQFPFPFTTTARFTLKGSTIGIELEAANVGDGPMPMGAGLHPWFRLPLSPSGDRGKCLVQIPASSRWELGPDRLPTGRVVPVPPGQDFRQLRALDDLHLDDLYTDLATEDGSWSCRYQDPSAGAEVVVGADSAFREAVIFSPAIRPVLCLEPYSCATDAFNLHNRGIDAGLVILEPGQSWKGRVRIEAGPAPR